MFEGVDVEKVQKAWEAYKAGQISAPWLKTFTELAGATIEINTTGDFGDPRILGTCKVKGSSEAEAIMRGMEADWISQGHETHLGSVDIDGQIWWAFIVYKKPEETTS